MLGEAFLTKFLYKEQRHAKLYKPLRCKKTSNDKKENWENKLLDTPDNSLSPLKTGSQEKVIEGSVTEQDNDSSQIKSMDELPVAKCKCTPLPGNVSVALPIPKRGQEETQLDLYRSWSCTSICQNYPDLQIGGDHIRNMYDSGCFVEHTYDDVCNGPLLLSVDIPLGHSPKMEPLEKRLPQNYSMVMKFEKKACYYISNPSLILCLIIILKERWMNSTNSFWKKILPGASL